MAKTDQSKDQAKENEGAAKAAPDLEALKAFVHAEVADPATHKALIGLIEHVAGLKGKA